MTSQVTVQEAVFPVATAGGWQVVGFVQSSDKKRHYEVTTNGKGAFGCSCPSWKFQKTSIQQRSCKHTRRFQKEV